MDDDSLMPFGQYKGRKMGDVPAAYLLYLWDDGVHAQTDRDIHKYIKECMSALLQDAPDHILKYKP